MKPKRRAVPGGRSRRTPTVRVVRPAITPVVRAPERPAGGARAIGRGAEGNPARDDEPALDALGGRPVDLTVDLGRGLVLPNPILAASGSMGYGVEVAELADLPRLGGLVTRGTTLRPRAGRGAPRASEVPGGMLWGVGPQNPGLEVVLERYAPAWVAWHVPVIVNLCGESASELADAARRLDGA